LFVTTALIEEQTQVSWKRKSITRASLGFLILGLAGLIGVQALSPPSPLTGLAALQAPPETPGTAEALRTPLPQAVLDILADEISGQAAFNNEVLLAGAPILREEAELNGTLFETQKIFDLARGYGLDARILRYPTEGTFDYARSGELWLVKPRVRLLARLASDAALVASGSASVDLTADLVYLPPLRDDQVKSWTAGGAPGEYRGKVALMWSHPSRETARALDAAGLAGVIAFESQDRYFDPDEVVYSRGAYRQMKSLTFGMTVSWRQWSELLDDLEHCRALTVRCRADVRPYPSRVEGVEVVIPGTEPEAKGVILTAHLLEGRAKRGANDNMSGCVAELEIARTLNKLIREGRLPAPRRTLTFLWTDEIWGTFEFIRRNPGLVPRLSADINMDMVGEGLRRNNAVFILTEATNARPSYLDGLGRSILNYIWRTNDIVYLPDSPENLRGEQVFPEPLWEKGGSRDAFRFDVQPATGGSDHVCFTNPAVGVPAVSLNVWPDQWYHTDFDTPDKSDPTQLRRTAFAGAAMAWAAIQCTDEVLAGLVAAVDDFGHGRLARRELPAALERIARSESPGLAAARRKAGNLVALAVERERGALETLADIAPDSESAREAIGARAGLWTFYGGQLRDLLDKAVEARAGQLRVPPPAPPSPTGLERRWDAVHPSLAGKVKAREFRLEQSAAYRDYVQNHPQALKDLSLSFAQRRALLDYVNGRRSILTIHDRAESETDTDIPLEQAGSFFEILRTIGWLEY
jgi:aminopeptidase YwaD